MRGRTRHPTLPTPALSIYQTDPGLNKMDQRKEWIQNSLADPFFQNSLADPFFDPFLSPTLSMDTNGQIGPLRARDSNGSQRTKRRDPLPGGVPERRGGFL